MSDVRPLMARGQRVWVSTVVPDDIGPYRMAVERSRPRLERWNPVDPEDLERHLRAQSAMHRTFMIHAIDPAGEHGIVGKVNVSNVIRGRFQSATMGYDAYDPYAGRGLFAEGLRLVIDLAFAPEDRGMALHRLEANVQPGNTTSAGLLRRLGFRREGRVSDMLWLADGAGSLAWRDHDMHAVTAQEWPSQPYAPHRPARIVAVVNGVPGAGKTTLARRLSAELGLVLLSKDTIKEAVGERLDAADQTRLGGPGSPLGAGCHVALWRLLADAPSGAVVESWFAPDTEQYVRAGLADAGVPVDRAIQVWCDVPLATARERYARREAQGERHPIHGGDGSPQMWDALARQSASLDLPHTLRVDTTAPVPDRTIVSLALHARAAAAGQARV